MSQKAKKDIYLGKSLKDLNGIVEQKSVKKIQEKQCRMYTKSAEKVYQNAMDQYLVEKDEEKAYILFMTFLSICQAIRKTQEYKKQKNYYDDMLAKKTLNAMTEAETLSASLKQRYEEREAVDVSKKLDSLNAESKPTVAPEVQEETTTGKDQNGDQTESKPVEPEKTVGTDKGTIECVSLYNLLTDSNTSVLILDVRTQQDFDRSHIIYRSCINVPPNAVKPGCVSKHIENELAQKYREAWRSRGRVEFVVIVDWDSNHDLLNQGSRVKYLKDAIFKWEQDVVIKSEPLLLEGGYSDWLNYYPTMTTNSNVTRPVNNTVTKPTVSLEQIGYDLDLNFLKSPEEIKPPQIPIQNGVYPDIPQNKTTHFEQQPGMNNRPPIPDRSLKQPVFNGTAVNNKINSTSDANNRNNVNSLSNNAGVLPNNIGIKNTNSSEIKTINNDLKSTKTTNLDELRSMLESKPNDGIAANTSTTNSAQVAAPAAKIPGVPSRNLKPQSKPSQPPNQAPAAEMLAEQQKIEQEKQKLEQEREELRMKMKHEQEQYERIKEMKLREAKETADLMRKKREVEGSLKPEKNQAASVKPDDADAVKARLDKLKREEEVEERRMQLASQRLATDIEAERKQKELDELKIRLEEKEKALEEKRRQEEQQKKEENERLEKARLLEQQRQEEEERKLEQERIRLEKQGKELELRRQRELEHARAQKAKKEQQRLEAERLEKEKQERARIEKERAETERALKAKAEQEKREREKAEVAQREKERQAEEARRLAAQASSTALPVGWEKMFDPQQGKYYYVNHTLKKTQWEAPNVSQRPQAAPAQPKGTESTPQVYKAKLRDEKDAPSSGGLKRSYSSPNIAKMMADKADAKAAFLPTVDRAAKPKVASDKTQLHTPVRTKMRNFDGIWGNVGSGLTGLRNMGNTCYMNSTLQCLSNTAFLTTYLLSDAYLQHLNRENKHGTGGELAEEFGVLIHNLWSAQYRSITPRDFKFTVARHNSMFAGYEQLDSQEFLLILLDSLHEDLNRVRIRPKLPEQKNDGVDDEVAGNRAWEMHKTVHDSIMVDLFQGQFKSSVMCKTCETKSVTFDTFMYLSLDIPSQSRCTLDECVRDFGKEEKMTGDSRWNCPRCKVKRDAVKRIVIWKLPPIVIIVLKRFYYKGMWRQKISVPVDFPLEGLDLNRYVSGPQRRKQYDLFAVSNHFGTLDGGHYTAFCKNPKLNKWFKFDDHEVYEYSKSNVKSPAAYFLFYSSIGNAFTS